MLEGTHHIAVIASNEQKALDFYVNKLGFTIEKETWRPAQGDCLRMLRLGDTVIELFIRPNAPSVSPNRRHWGCGILPSG